MLQIRQVRRAFGTLKVLHDLNLSVPTGEIMCLLGPSGCGKSTLLRIIAGVEQAESGDVTFEGKRLNDVPPHQRGFGLMFQDFALFPHLTVAENVAFGLKMQNLGAAETRQRVNDMLNLVGLANYEKRDVAHLSGGERQRVALARSLAPNPKLIMLDEPLGSLDAVLRDELVNELRSIIKQLDLTAIYVTHDQREAFAVADRIAVMNRGKIEQVAVPADLYFRPTTEFAAHFLGFDNIVPISAVQDGQADTPLGQFPAVHGAQKLLLHPDYIALSHTNVNSAFTINAVVTRVTFQGGIFRVQLRHASGVTITVNMLSTFNTPPTVNDDIRLYIDMRGIISLAE